MTKDINRITGDNRFDGRAWLQYEEQGYKEIGVELEGLPRYLQLWVAFELQPDSEWGWNDWKNVSDRSECSVGAICCGNASTLYRRFDEATQWEIINSALGIAWSYLWKVVRSEEETE